MYQSLIVSLEFLNYFQLIKPSLNDKASNQLYFHLLLFSIIAKMLCYMCHWKFFRAVGKLSEAFDTDVCTSKFKAFSVNWKSLCCFFTRFILSFVVRNEGNQSLSTKGWRKKNSWTVDLLSFSTDDTQQTTKDIQQAQDWWHDKQWEQ